MVALKSHYLLLIIDFRQDVPTTLPIAEPLLRSSTGCSDSSISWLVASTIVTVAQLVSATYWHRTLYCTVVRSVGG